MGSVAEMLLVFSKILNSQIFTNRHQHIWHTTNYPILTECYKVAAYNAANKLASVRHAARAADPLVPAEPSAPVVVAGR